MDALVFRGLLLRQQALVEKDQAKVKALLQEATELSERANALRKQKSAGRQLVSTFDRSSDDWIARPPNTCSAAFFVLNRHIRVR